jgi:hypothetical protein
MSQTEPIRSETFFAEFLLPLSRANARRNIRYLKLERETASYWAPVASRTGGMERLTAATVDGAAMLERLGRYWGAQGDVMLPKLLPYLVSLRAKIADPSLGEAAVEAQVPEFVYPLF